MGLRDKDYRKCELCTRLADRPPNAITSWKGSGKAGKDLSEIPPPTKVVREGEGGFAVSIGGFGTWKDGEIRKSKENWFVF
jgi:hypothetical protein